MPSGKAITKEQREFINLKREELSPKQIASRLGLNRATVINHMKNQQN